MTNILVLDQDSSEDVVFTNKFFFFPPVESILPTVHFIRFGLIYKKPDERDISILDQREPQVSDLFQKKPSNEAKFMVDVRV